MVMPRRSALRLATAGLALGGIFALAGCDTTQPVQVTRFHLAQPLARGSFAIETAPMAGPGAPMADGIELSTYNDIVAGELTRLGFTRAPSVAGSELVVSVSVDRGARPDPRPHGAALSFGVGGGSFGRHGGVGGDVGTTVPLGGRQEHFLVGTRMMVQIKRRSDGTAIWEGRATTEASGQAPDASPQAAAAKLAHALFLGFPGESGRTINVK